MTVKELIKNLQDLPEELQNSEVEMVYRVELIEDYVAREDKYVNVVAFNSDSKEVVLFSQEDFDTFTNQ